MMGQIRVADGGADPKPAVRHRLDRAQRQPVDVDEPRRRLHVQLHQVEQGGATGEEAHVGALLRGLCLRSGPDGRRRIACPGELEGAHQAPRRTRWIAATMLG